MAEHKASLGQAEIEIKRMIAILNAAFPKYWRIRVVRDVLRGEYHAALAVEKFNGIDWTRCCVPADSSFSHKSREAAFKALLASWSRREGWTEKIKFWPNRIVELPVPPAASAEELCLKLDLAGENRDRGRT